MCLLCDYLLFFRNRHQNVPRDLRFAGGFDASQKYSDSRFCPVSEAEPFTVVLRQAAGLLWALLEAKLSVIFWLPPPPAPAFLEPLDMSLALPAPSVSP
jgi:hypothetical protein